uniref:Uncharacterized protein n=1 Tax=Rhizophora mucronata TaxID=61149 RepID=A0A2P2IX44_RHIMU
MINQGFVRFHLEPLQKTPLFFAFFLSTILKEKQKNPCNPQ